MKFLKIFTQGLPNTLLITACVVASGFLSGVILGHALAPTLRGEFAAVLLWPSVLAILGELGLGFAFSFYVEKEKDKIDALWTIACLVSFVWGGMLAIAGGMAIPLLVHFSSSARICLMWNLVTVPLSLLSGYAALFLLGTNRIFQYNVVRLLNASLYSLGVVLLFFFHRITIENFTFVYILSVIIGCVVAVGFIFKYFKPKWQWQVEVVKRVFLYGGKTYLSSLASQMNLRFDQLYMSSAVSFEQLGFYVVAVSFSSMIMPLFVSLAIVTLPRVTLAKDLSAKTEQTIRYFQLGLITGIPPMIVAIIIAPWLLPILFSIKYTHSILLAQILLAGVIFQGSNVILGHALRGLGHPGKPAIAEGMGLIVTIVLLLWLVPIYGALGAALTSLAAYALVTFAQLYFVKQVTKIKIYDFFMFSIKFLFPTKRPS